MAQLKRGSFPATSLHEQLLHLSGAVIGAGAANATLDTVRAAKDNFISSCSWSSTGLYVATFKEMPGNIIDARATLHRAAGTTLVANVRSWSTTASTKTVTFDVRDMAAAGALADATTSDTIVITVEAKNSRA